MSENGWVKLPEPAPRMLPKGTLFKSAFDEAPWMFTHDVTIKGDDYYTGEVARQSDGRKVEGDHAAAMEARTWKLPPGYRFEGREVVRACVCTESSKCAQHFFGHDLGDTPEHLKPLLRAAREEIPGTIVQDDGDMTPILWSPIRDHGGWYAGGLELQGYSLTTMHQSICRRDRLQRAIEQGRCYPTADARRIGREEFGMAFEGIEYVADTATEPPKVTSPMFAMAGGGAGGGSDYQHGTISAGGGGAVAGGYGYAGGTVGGGCGGGHGYSNAPIQRATGKVDFEFKLDVRPGTSSEKLKAELEKAFGRVTSKSACACGATENVRPIGYDTDALSPESARRNVMLPELMCATCYQSRRRTELQATKVEQAKADLDRKATPKWCEAPAMWPEQFSGSSWEE